MSKDSLEPPSSKQHQNQPKPNKNGVPEFKQKVTKLDVKLDNQVKYEFGGPVGVTVMMLGFPCLMYYFWVCLEFHQGRLIYPSDLSQWKYWVVQEIWEKVKLRAAPTTWAIQMYMGYVLFSFVLAYTMPGPVVEGLPIPSLNGQRVNISALFVMQKKKKQLLT
jgi:delta24(24(1))-sterol reductase